MKIIKNIGTSMNHPSHKLDFSLNTESGGVLTVTSFDQKKIDDNITFEVTDDSVIVHFPSSKHIREFGRFCEDVINIIKNKEGADLNE